MESSPVGALSLNFLIGYSTSLSVFGSNLPMNISPKSVYQTLPSLSTSTSCGSLFRRTLTHGFRTRPPERPTNGATGTTSGGGRPAGSAPAAMSDYSGNGGATDLG